MKKNSAQRLNMTRKSVGRKINRRKPAKRLTDFSTIESQNPIHVLEEVGRAAGKQAVERANKLGLPTIIMEEDKIYKVYPDGHREEVIAQPIKKKYVKYKRGTILHASE